MKNTKLDWSKIIPIILPYFVSGLIAMIGALSNYIQLDFDLSDAQGGLLASAIYIWFLVMAIPSGFIINKIGTKNTVLLSLIINCVALTLPFINYSFSFVLISLFLMGIGNSILQISLNLLISNVIPKKRLSSILTFGQFVGQIPAIIIPFLAALSIHYFKNWQYIYPFFFVISLLITIKLYRTTINEEEKDPEEDKVSINDYIKLLKNLPILLMFIGIICQVGIDVSSAITLPKILINRINLDVREANFITSIYSTVKFFGCLLGAFLLTRLDNYTVLIGSLILLFISAFLLIFVNELYLIYICAGFLGLGVANIFAVIFSTALLTKPSKKTEISGLMIMGLVGGAIFPPIMGFANNLISNNIGSLIIILICTIYLFSIKKYFISKD